LPSEEIETAVAVAPEIPSSRVEDDSFVEERSATTGTKTPEEDRATFVSRVAEKIRTLAATSENGDTVSGTAGTDSSADLSVATPVPVPVDNEAGGEATGTGEIDESRDAAVKVPVKPAAETPILPDSYRRSLKAYGWEDAAIDKNLQTMGKDFIDTAAKIHSNRNSEVGQWAEAGRQAREQQSKSGVTPQQTALSSAGSLQSLDVEKLKEEYGEDALITKLVLPMSAMIERINWMLPAVQETQQRASQAEQDALLRQIDGFFGSKEMDAFKEIYGSGNELTTEHFTARNKVLEMADALVVGASMQHRRLSSADALQMAHDSVSSGFKKQEARVEIKGQLTKRAKGVTLRPSSRQPVKRSGEGMTREELVKVVSQKLAAMRGDNS